MSPVRWRRGGTDRLNTFSRNSGSWRKRTATTSASRSRWVAHATRTSTGTGLPTDL